MNPWANNAWQSTPPWHVNTHPHVFVPPSGYNRPPAGYWEQYAWNRTDLHFNEYRSKKYPNLNPILAADTSLVRFDTKKKPSNEIQATTFYSNRQSIATANSATHIRLYSKSFPWAIDIKSTSPITCEAVWDSIYAALQEPIVDSEWALAVSDKERRHTIEAAFRKREGADKHMKRIDWLGDLTMFKGLEQDDDFQKTRLPPGTTSCAETYLVKMEGVMMHR